MRILCDADDCHYHYVGRTVRHDYTGMCKCKDGELQLRASMTEKATLCETYRSRELKGRV